MYFKNIYANIYLFLPSSNAMGFLFWMSLFINILSANHTARTFILYYTAEDLTNDVNGRCIVVSCAVEQSCV